MTNLSKEEMQAIRRAKDPNYKKAKKDKKDKKAKKDQGDWLQSRRG